VGRQGSQRHEEESQTRGSTGARRARTRWAPARANLTRFTDRRGKVTVYHYDGLNRRPFAGFGYDGDRVVEEIPDGGSNVLTAMGFSRLDQTGNMTFLPDALGSTLALTDNK